jgi:hypothetical protein
MINRVLDLPGVRVGQLVTPMDQVVAVGVDTPMAEVMRLCREQGLTRLPVWQRKGKDRRVAGIVSLKRCCTKARWTGRGWRGSFAAGALPERGVEPGAGVAADAAQRAAVGGGAWVDSAGRSGW